jgi:hypothetical protein
MQSEMHFNDTVASSCQTEHSSKVYQELHCSKRRVSDCSQLFQNRNVHHINDVTDASDCVNCSCAGAEALEPLASNQAKGPKRDAEYLEIVASDANDHCVCGDSKPSSCQANYRHQHGDDYLQLVPDDDYLQLVADDDYFQLVAYEDYLQIVAYDYYTQLVANDNYLQQVALGFRYHGTCIKWQ